LSGLNAACSYERRWPSSASQSTRSNIRCSFSPRAGLSADTHAIRPRRCVADRPKRPVDPCGRDRREEITQVEREQDRSSGMAAGMADHRATASEAGCIAVDGDVVEDLAQHPPLDLLKPCLRGLDHPRQARGARHAPVPVVAKALAGDRAFEPADVGQPRQLAEGQLQQLRQRRHRFDHRDRPVMRERGPPPRQRGHEADRLGRLRLTVVAAPCKEQLDQRRQSLGLANRRGPVRGRDGHRQRRHPARPPVEAADTALAQPVDGPGAVDERARELTGDQDTVGILVHLRGG
jgi:hypothetical protein